ncbi:MAG TPA: hypothetical protein VGY55_21680 [Pirellulales bacterium]|nr:hypothetical protein [Pirellulales bacterium]
MATILYAWELGGGLGHILRSLPLAQKLAARGHRVIATLRELRRAENAFGGAAVQYLPAPHLAWRIPDPIEPVRKYADLLHNVGFAHAEDLRILTRAWQTLFALVRPDLILCDHSPSALLAASIDEIPCALIGTGFCCPPAGATLPNLRSWLKGNAPVPQRSLVNGEGTKHPQTGPLPKGERDERVLANINEIRAARGNARWVRLSQLYSSVAETFLTTFAELDHFPDRGDAKYLGAWESDQGKAFAWPSGNGPRVFMYTHRFPARDWLLEHLRQRGYSTVAYTHDLPREAAEKLVGPTLRLASAPLDIAQAAPECDVAILNAGHNSAAQFLLAGKPLLLLPISLEQGLLMRRLVEQGLAISAPPDRPAAIEAALNDLLSNSRYRDAARVFAAKYASYNPEAAQDRIVARIEELAQAAAST